MAVFLIAAATTAGAVLFLLGSVAGGRPVNLDAGPSCFLLALSVGAGVLVSGRFRAWGLRRRA